jgi:phage gpG-like protein
MSDTTVELDSKEWDDYLKQVGKKLEDSTNDLKVAVNIFGFKDIQEHFHSESGPNGGWEPLKYRKGKILQDTGTLRNSLLPGGGLSSEAKNEVLMFVAGPASVYAGTHNYGRGAIPQREFMWLSENAQEQILNYVMNEIAKD